MNSKGSAETLMSSDYRLQKPMWSWYISPSVFQYQIVICCVRKRLLTSPKCPSWSYPTTNRDFTCDDKGFFCCEGVASSFYTKTLVSFLSLAVVCQAVQQFYSLSLYERVHFAVTAAFWNRHSPMDSAPTSERAGASTSSFEGKCCLSHLICLVTCFVGFATVFCLSDV